jgi:outer membrane protein OmpA-like peptidoglycan-associated protein
MPAKPMLDQVELMQVDKVEEVENEVVAQHGVPALEGDFLQDLGRRAIRVTLTGTLTGPTAGDGLKSLREKFRAAEPVPFVEDIASATKVDKVLIEDMDVRELAGKPERFEYALTLLEFTPPPKPEPEPPPPSPPPPPQTDSGKAVVEVTVAGQPNADVSAATVSLEGTQDDGTQLSRTLSNRTNNVWNDDAVPVGSYAAKATLAGSPAMLGTADAKISAGQTTQVTITLQPGALVATEFVVHFRFDKAFVEPCMRDVLQEVIDHAAAHPDEKLVIVGHTDLVGSPTDLTGPDPYNQSLSERRARAVYAFLTFGRDKDNAIADWSALRQKQTAQAKTLADNWGTRQYQHMLQDLGFYPGNVDGVEGNLTQDAVRAFRRKHGLPDGTAVDDDVWTALIGDYLGQDNFAIPDSQFFRNCGNEPLKWIGCASQDPVNRTRQAHRPNRRVELLFINTDKFPVSEPQPDTFDLPSPGAVAGGWCMKATGDPQDSKRAAFVVPHQPPNGKPAPGQWSRQPAEPGTITVQVSIKKEVKKADGSTELQPVGAQKFIVTAADGEFQASELTSGEPQPAVTKADGTQSFSNKPLGIYCLEVLAPVLVRLAEDDASSAKGNAVCKHLTADDNHLDVVILPDPPLREINLRAAVHLMTALTPAIDTKAKTRLVRTCPDPLDATKRVPQATTHKASDVTDFFVGANEIWQQARVHFDPVNIVEETYSFRTECEVDDNEFAAILERCAYPNVTNVFFFGDLAGAGEAGEFVLATVPPPDPRGQVDGCAVSDRTQQQLFQNVPPVNISLTNDETIQVLAHELGHYLGLAANNVHPTGATQLMRAGTSDGSNRTITPPEATGARNSNNAALEFVPVSLKVTGAAQVGGSLSHEFLVVQNSTPPPPPLVTVDAVVSDSTGTVVMSGGGNPGANSQQKTVSTGSKGVTEIDATFAPAGGGTPTLTRAEVRVATFNLSVDGAKQVGSSTTFVTKPDPNNLVVVTIQLDPAPFCIPATLIQWTNGDATPDPLCRSTATRATGAVTINATIAGVAKSVTIAVVEAALTSNDDPFGAGVATAQIEGVLNQNLKSFDLPNLFGTQPRSLLRARATLPTVTGNTVQGALIHKDSTGAIVETIPITLTKKADTFLSLPIVAIPIILKSEITQKQPKTLEVVPAQAGDRLVFSVKDLGGVSSAEVPVRARTVAVFAETFTDASTTAKDLKATAADVRRQIARANRIWAQAGVEIKERSVNDAVPDPGGLLQLDDNGTATLTTDEQKLLGHIPGGPAHSATATDLNVYYVEDIKGAASGLSFKGRTPRVTALEGPHVSDAALAHEIGHWLLVGWGSPAGIGIDGNPTLAGDEHVDLNGRGWPETNVMNKFDTNKDGNVDQTQAANILPSVSPVVVVLP